MSAPTLTEAVAQYGRDAYLLTIAISATSPPGGGPFSFFAANFYPIEEGARGWANG